MALYAAADVPLPEITPQMPPAPLSARPIDGTESAVRTHFTKPHIYFLGSHTGCSCGFQYGLYGREDEDRAGRESVRQLGAYLFSAVARAGPIEVYACWDGDEAEPDRDRATMTPADFSGDAERFELVERRFATVVMPGRYDSSMDENRSSKEVR
jgi:hypothetical protein